MLLSELKFSISATAYAKIIRGELNPTLGTYTHSPKKHAPNHCLVFNTRRPHSPIYHRLNISSAQAKITMVKLCIFVGTTVGSGAFGYAGDALGLSFFWSFMLSGVGGVLGVYAGWKVAQHYR